MAPVYGTATPYFDNISSYATLTAQAPILAAPNATATSAAATLQAQWNGSALPNGCPSLDGVTPLLADSASLDLGYLARCGACFQATPNPAFASDLVIPSFGNLGGGALGTAAPTQDQPWLTPWPTWTPTATTTPGPSPTPPTTIVIDDFSAVNPPYPLGARVFNYPHLGASTGAGGIVSDRVFNNSVTTTNASGTFYVISWSYDLEYPMNISSWQIDVRGGYNTEGISVWVEPYRNGASLGGLNSNVSSGAGIWWTRNRTGLTYTNVDAVYVQVHVRVASGGFVEADNFRFTGVNYFPATPPPTWTPQPSPTPVGTPVPSATPRTGFGSIIIGDTSACAVPVLRDTTPIAGLNIDPTTIAQTCLTVIPPLNWTFLFTLQFEETQVCINWFAMFQISLFGLTISADWLLIIPVGWFIRRWLMF